MDARDHSVVVTTGRDAGPHLTAAGQLDPDGAVRLHAQLDDAIAPATAVTLDLSRVTYLSSEALAVLVHAYCRLRDGSGSLVLTAASPSVIRVLRVSGLHRVLPVDAPVPAEAAVPAADPLPAEDRVSS